MSDPRETFLTGLNFSEIEVREYPEIAFLCGGPPNAMVDRETSHQYFPSVRSYVSQFLTAKYPHIRYQNAEDVKDWNSYSAYDDLIEFERDIAHLCKAIVLFVESPGSLAELGSFAIIPEITEKLIIFVHADHSSQSSFISLGPLKRIDDARQGRIHHLTWSEEIVSVNGETHDVLDLTTFEKWSDYTCTEIENFLKTKHRAHHSPEQYDRTKEALFIHDVIQLFKAVEFDEIRTYFGLVSHEIERKQIQRSLFCLEKLGLIRPVSRGAKTYFISEEPDSSRYLVLPVGKDTARLAMQLDEYYKHRSQLARREAIDQLSRGRE
jgi:hypothetical protein